jgi:hypothetical protein
MLKASTMIAALITLSVAQLPGVAVGKHAYNRTYVQSGPGGAFYARCIPTAQEGSAGRTKIYRVEEAEDELLETYDLYPSAVVIGWSPIAGKVALMAVVQERAENWKQQEELRFLIGGKLLKSYTSADLVAMGADEQMSSERGQRAAYRVGDCEQVPGTNDYDFIVEIKGGVRLRFDILTGTLRTPGK